MLAPNNAVCSSGYRRPFPMAADPQRTDQKLSNSTLLSTSPYHSTSTGLPAVFWWINLFICVNKDDKWHRTFIFVFDLLSCKNQIKNNVFSFYKLHLLQTEATERWHNVFKVLGYFDIFQCMLTLPEEHSAPGSLLHKDQGIWSCDLFWKGGSASLIYCIILPSNAYLLTNWLGLHIYGQHSRVPKAAFSPGKGIFYLLLFISFFQQDIA